MGVLCVSFTTVGGLVSEAVEFRLHTHAIPPQSPKAGEFERGALMRESNTRTLKPKKLQTATMKRRSLKLKSIEALPTKARSPQVRAPVISAPQPLA